MYALLTLVVLLTVLAYACAGYFIGQSYVVFLDHAEKVSQMLSRK